VEVILASASSRRRDLLNQIGLKHRVMVSGVNEDSLAGQPRDLVERLARAKAQKVATGVEFPAVVIGADTAVVLGEKVLGKPADERQAVLTLMELAGQWHQVLTGLAVVGPSSDRVIAEVETTMVKMRHFGRDVARAYVATGEPMDKAGAYGIQGRGALLVEEIRGCYSNVVGLPLSRLGLMLERAGILPFRPGA